MLKKTYPILFERFYYYFLIPNSVKCNHAHKKADNEKFRYLLLIHLSRINV